MELEKSCVLIVRTKEFRCSSESRGRVKTGRDPTRHPLDEVLLSVPRQKFICSEDEQISTLHTVVLPIGPGA